MKDSPYLSPYQLNQTKDTFFTLRHILQNGQWTITRERIENSHQMTPHDTKLLIQEFFIFKCEFMQNVNLNECGLKRISTLTNNF